MTLTWYRRILAAKKRGGFTRDDDRAASDWNSCAVGEKADWSEVGPYWCPASNEPDAISSLGIRFAVAVSETTTPPSPFASTVRSIA